MTENFKPPSTDDEYEANVSLTYDYVEKSVSEARDISDNINNKFLLLATFNLTYIHFFLSDLPQLNNYVNFLPCNSCLLLKILSYIFSACSITCCFIGLYSNTEYFIINPKVLINECDRTTISGLKLAIIETKTTKLESFIKLAEQKKKFFNYSMFLFLISALAAVIDISIDSIFNSLL